MTNEEIIDAIERGVELYNIQEDKVGAFSVGFESGAKLATLRSNIENKRLRDELQEVQKQVQELSERLVKIIQQ